MLGTFDTCRKLLICLFLVVTTLAVYWPVKDCEFIHYDDDLYVLNNPHIQEGFSIESIKWAFTSTHTGNWYPLTWLSLMLDLELYGLNPAGYHWSNLLLHIANTLLLFFFLSRITGAAYKSAFVAALFALHPLHVESVAWVSERKDVLSTLFWMLTIDAYVKYVERPAIIRYLLVLILFFLGLMAKSMLVTLPFVLLLMDFWPLERFPRRQPDEGIIISNQIQTKSTGHDIFIRRLIYEKIPLIILTIPVSVVTIIAQRQAGAMQPIEWLPLDMRAANALTSYVLYIWKMLIPSDLSVFYPHPGICPIWQVVLCSLFLALISAAVLKFGKRYPYLPVGWFWYLGTLVPVIGLVQTGSQAMADRYSYIPLIGLFIVATWGSADILKKYRYCKAILASLALAVIIVAITFTSQQLRYWQNGIALWRRNITITAPNFTSHYNLGVTLMDKGDYAEATSEFRKSLQLKPDSASAHNNLGISLYRQGEIQQAINEYEAALRLKPNHTEAHMNLAMIFFQKGSFELSIHHLNEVIKSMNLETSPESSSFAASDPERLIIQFKFAQVNYLLASALKKQGKIEEAKSHYEIAIKINPAYADMGFK